MKFTKLAVGVLAIAGLAVMSSSVMAARNGNANVPRSAATTLDPLSDAEIATLRWMREEEKLARDIYITLNTYFPAQIFTNIAASEQKHFDALGRKLDQYGIDDPAVDAIGVFADPQLQALYAALLAQGMVSYVEALKVGVVIEETDLTDLEVAIEGTDSVPLDRTYQHLLTGSEHHLAAFTRLLGRDAATP